jgi:STIP1 family protein 1
MALLKLHSYPSVITDSHHALDLNTPHHTFNPPTYAPGTQGTVMKAYFQLAQAQIALNKSEEGLKSAREAHRLCVEEIYIGGKGASSIGPITELVLRCKKEDWERREDERLKLRGGLLEELVGLLGKEGDWGKAGELRRVFDAAKIGEGEARRRKVPDWCVDDITFSVMLDPVVVSLYPFPSSQLSHLSFLYPSSSTSNPSPSPPIPFIF